MREDGQGVALAVVFHYARERLLAGGIGPQEQAGRFGEGPLEVGVANFGARGPLPLASRFLGARHQTAIGDERLPPGQAMDVMDVIQPHEG
jgi:hypothetical protein